MNAEIDERNHNFLRFADCFMNGASLQDIYAESKHGFAVREQGKPADSAVQQRRMKACRRQFLRIFEHLTNIAEPVDQYVGLQGKTVLDFGCGTGALSVALALKGARVVGVDPTPLSLEAAKWRARYFDCEHRFEAQLVGTAPGMPFEAKSFDIVILNSVMEFIPHHRHKYVLDFLRLIKPGGHLIISTENGIFPWYYYTKELFPFFRRKTMVRENLPYGITYFELLRWIRQSPVRVDDLCIKNRFNSIDKLTARQRTEGRAAMANVLGTGNWLLKRACSLMGVPSDILLPYATYIFRVTT
jgi:2-polyprenyl-3-methyl-5-hydroxy-6-metoxy-1,4-benzoquinol methylase